MAEKLELNVAARPVPGLNYTTLSTMEQVEQTLDKGMCIEMFYAYSGVWAITSPELSFYKGPVAKEALSIGRLRARHGRKYVLYRPWQCKSQYEGHPDYMVMAIRATEKRLKEPESNPRFIHWVGKMAYCDVDKDVEFL